MLPYLAGVLLLYVIKNAHSFLDIQKFLIKQENSWYSKTLLSANISVINQDHCIDDLGVNITSDMICAGNVLGSKDTCTGDNGGPLTVNQRLAGITSWGFGCGWLYRPRVYANVAHFKNWIEEYQKLLKAEEKNYDDL